MAVLPRRPVFLPDESPSSLLFRAAIANGWRAHLLLGKYLQVEYASVQYVVARASIFQGILRDMGIAEGQVRAYRAVRPTEQSPLIWNGVETPRHWMRLNECALCPDCIATDAEPYGRSRWDHRLVRSCALHSVLLVDRCESCCELITWGREHFCKCPCGFDFRDSQRIQTNADEVLLIEEATTNRDKACLDAACAIDLALARLTAAGALKSFPPESRSSVLIEAIHSPSAFAQRLKRCSEGPSLASTRIVFRDLIMMNDSKYTRALWEAFESQNLFAIPGHWHIDLASRLTIEQCQQIVGSNRIAHRLIERGLLAHSKTDALAPPGVMARELNDIMIGLLPCEGGTALDRPRRIQGIHAAEAIVKVLSGRLRSGGYALAKGLSALLVDSNAEPVDLRDCTLTELASRAEVHPEYIRFLFHCKFLPGRRGPNRAILISWEDAEVFLREYSFVRPLARSLGMNHTNLAEKLAAIGIKPVSGPSIDGGLCYLFRRHDLADLDPGALASLESYATRAGRKKRTERPPPAELSYSEAARELELGIGTIGRLVGRELLHRSGERGRDRTVCVKSVAAFKAMVHDPNFMTEADALRCLAETIAQFRRRWIMTGLLVVRDLEVVRQYSRVKVESIVALKQHYSTATDLAERNGVVRTHFNNHSRLGLCPRPSRIGKGSRSLNLYAASSRSDRSR